MTMGDRKESSGPLSDEDLDKYGFVASSQRRASIVKCLNNNPATPKELSKRSDINMSHVSNLLSDLRDEGIAVCVNPDRKRGRVYRLTDQGERVAAKLLEDK